MSGSVNRFPPGWDDERVRSVIDHYESQTEDEALAEDEAAFADRSQTTIVVPNELVPAVMELLSDHEDAQTLTKVNAPSP